MKLFYTIAFILFSSFIYGQSNKPSLTVGNFEYLLNANMEKRETYLESYKFKPLGIEKEDSITTYKYVFSDMGFDTGQTLSFFVVDSFKKGIGYFFYDEAVYKNFKNSMKDRYEYLGDEISVELGGLGYKNKIGTFFIILKTEEVEKLSGSKAPLYSIMFKNF